MEQLNQFGEGGKESTNFGVDRRRWETNARRQDETRLVASEFGYLEITFTETPRHHRLKPLVYPPCTR